MGRGHGVGRFVLERPAPDASWRALILFGDNTTSYKFALGRSLLDIARTGKDRVTAEELAGPFAEHLCQHLAVADRQGLNPTNRYLDACRAHLADDLSADDLRPLTQRLGFRYVLDAFHRLDRDVAQHEFFVDERRSNGTIRLTDHLHALAADEFSGSLVDEVESRWALVETAWRLDLPPSVLVIGYDATTQALLAPERKRAPVTSARGGLNGYQRGACFYCFAPISTEAGHPLLGEVDHVFAWANGELVGGAPVDGIWNLVLACHGCNNWHAKRDLPPDPRYVERLHRRNEHLITSHHPLRDTLIAQSGATEAQRAVTLRRALIEVSGRNARSAWTAAEVRPPQF